MAQSASLPAHRFSQVRAIGPVCAAHFLSHYYMMMLAPLFAFVRADYAVSYTKLALALTVFNVVSAALQTPAGFLVDRIGARGVLIAGVALGAAAFAVAGLVHSFVVFVAMYAVAGLGNTAYHPADYSLLSRSAPASVGQVFSFHTFFGILGSALAPVTLLIIQSRFGWRGAYVGAAIFGCVVLLILLAQRDALAERATKPRDAVAGHDNAEARGEPGGRLLLSPPIVLSLCFFILIALMGGLASFLVVALAALYGTPDKLANLALTGLLLMSALGVLIGGALAVRVKHHAAVAVAGLVLAGIATALIGIVGASPTGLVLATALSGLFGGIVSPSRDMLVRAFTPSGAFGRVFGFVSSGFNVGSMIAPMVYGLMMDHHAPRAVFLFSAGCSIACIATVAFGFAGRRYH